MDYFSFNFTINNIKQNNQVKFMKFNKFNLSQLNSCSFMRFYSAFYIGWMAEWVAKFFKLMGVGALFRTVVFKPEYLYISKVYGSIHCSFAFFRFLLYITSKAGEPENILAVEFPCPISFLVYLFFTLKTKFILFRHPEYLCCNCRGVKT